jgi:hypothetical protein
MTTSVDISYLPVPPKQDIDISDLPVPQKQGIDISDLPVPPASIPTSKQADKPIKLEISDAEAEKAAASKFTFKQLKESASSYLGEAASAVINPKLLSEEKPLARGLGAARKPLSGAVPSVADTSVQRLERSTLFARPEEKLSIKALVKPQTEEFKERYIVETENPIPLKEIYNKDSEYFKKVKDYMESRGGESGKQGKDESDKDYINRFFTHMRKVENNYMLDARPELAYLTNTSVDNALKAGEAYKIWDRVPSFFMKSGQEGIRPLAETVFAQTTDPLTYLGYGVSKGVVLGRVAMGRKVMQEAVKDKLKGQAVTAATPKASVAAAAPKAPVYAPAAVAGTAVEFTSSALQDAGRQQIDIEAGLRDIQAEEGGKVAKIKSTPKGNIVSIIGDDGTLYHKFVPPSDSLRVDVGQEINKGDVLNIPKVDKTSAAIMGAFGAILNLPEIRQGARVAPDKMIKQYEDRLADRKVVLSKSEKARQDAEVKAIEDLFTNDDLTKFDVFEGRKFLNELAPPTEITESQIRKDINKRALDAAKYLMLADPTLRPEPNQKISDFVRDLFMTSDKIDDMALESALNRAGLTVREFAQASRTTIQDAAIIMQQASVLGKMFKRAGALDDEAKKLFDAKLLNDSSTGPFASVYNAVKAVDKNVRAVVVSGIGTTVRNVIGTSGALTLDAASNLLESTLYNTGRVIGAAVTGKYEKGDVGRGLNNIVKDTFGTFHYLTNVGLSSRITDDLLKYNPNFKESFLGALQESGNEELTRFARFVNTFNVAQDAMFRKAVFNASVSKQLRDVGVNMLDVLATDKTIPKEILQRAADDALKMTFSYTPKFKKITGAEQFAENIGSLFVKTVESAPVLLTGPIPFPRFVTNAIAWQYRNNVISQPIAGTAQLARAANAAFKNKDMAKAEALAQDGLDRISKGVVGGGVLAWAYNTRSNSQDTKPTEIKTPEGDTVDLASLAPVPAAFLAVADVVYKFNNDEIWKINWKELTKTLTGLESAGIRNTLFDNLPDMIQVAKDISDEGAVNTKEVRKVLKTVGQSFGDYFNMLLQPASPLIAAISSFDREEQVARDPNVVEGEGGDLVLDAMLKRIQNKIPGWKQSLPEAIPYLRPDYVSPEAEQIVRPTQFFDVLAGTRFNPQANALEKEVLRIGMEPWEFFKPSGDRKMDRALIIKSRSYIRDIVMPRLDAPEYQQKSDLERRKAFRNYMSTAINAAREELKGSVASDDFNRYSKMQYENLSKLDRAGLNAFVERQYNEKSPEITGDYSRAMELYQEYNALSQ